VKQLDKKFRLSAKMQQDLLLRSKQGIWAHPICAALVLATTDLSHRAPALCWSFAASILLQTVLRLALLRKATTGPGQRKTGHVGPALLMAAPLFCSAIWGITAGVALWSFGYRDKDVLTLLLYHAVIAFGTVNLFVHDRRWITVAMALLFVPLLAGDLLRGGEGSFAYLGAAAAFLLYCFLQGKKLNQMYQDHISDNYDLSVAAYRDSLTGLPNRLYMDEALESSFEQARRDPHPIALLYIDLDGFKEINDRYSHKVGDLFLCEVAERIRRGLRKNDIVARIGGDEFNILLSDSVSEQEALRVASRVLRDARIPMKIDGENLRYSASIGISLFPGTAETLDSLIHSADQAMYFAKGSGKDRICMLLAGGERRIACV
jgi:diguanylate cyclase (GGDEF)-like protein